MVHLYVEEVDRYHDVEAGVPRSEGGVREDAGGIACAGNRVKPSNMTGTKKLTKTWTCD